LRSPCREQARTQRVAKEGADDGAQPTGQVAVPTEQGVNGRPETEPGPDGCPPFRNSMMTAMPKPNRALTVARCSAGVLTAHAGAEPDLNGVRAEQGFADTP
jgi:hypothetical protein